MHHEYIDAIAYGKHSLFLRITQWCYGKDKLVGTVERFLRVEVLFNIIHMSSSFVVNV
jgi:hypothetical protein